MAKLRNRFWVGFMIVLSIVFAFLFFPLMQRKFFLTDAILLTMAGVAVIWGAYFIRVYIFSRVFWREHD